MKNLLNNHPKTILFCLGCLSALAMAPVYAWPLMALGYATLLIYLLKARTWKTASLYSFVFFFGYFLSGLYWISNSLFVDFDTWWWALPFAFIGLPFLLSLFPAICSGIAYFVPRFRTISFIIALILADLARGHLLTGFPWNLPAHTWVNNELIMQSLPMIGFYGLNTLTIIVVSTLFIIPRAIAGVVIILCVASGFWQSPHNVISLKNITLIQANIPQHEKWDSQFVERNLDRYIEMSQNALKDKKNSQILIWPETAISRNLLSYPRLSQKFGTFLRSLPEDSHLITGYLDYKVNENYNSLIVMNTKGEIISSYDKHHLVPFGEYMPFGLDTITGFNGFTSGTKPTSLTVGDTSFLPLICYEIIFPRYSASSSNNDFILNITNDAWFGKTAGPYQHFDHARFRAVENKTPVIRISGNGISGLIDSHGRPIKTSPLNKLFWMNFP